MQLQQEARDVLLRCTGAAVSASTAAWEPHYAALTLGASQGPNAPHASGFPLDAGQQWAMGSTSSSCGMAGRQLTLDQARPGEVDIPASVKKLLRSASSSGKSRDPGTKPQQKQQRRLASQQRSTAAQIWDQDAATVVADAAAPLDALRHAAATAHSQCATVAGSWRDQLASSCGWQSTGGSVTGAHTAEGRQALELSFAMAQLAALGLSSTQHGTSGAAVSGQTTRAGAASTSKEPHASAPVREPVGDNALAADLQSKLEARRQQRLLQQWRSRAGEAGAARRRAAGLRAVLLGRRVLRAWQHVWRAARDVRRQQQEAQQAAECRRAEVAARFHALYVQHGCLAGWRRLAVAAGARRQEQVQAAQAEQVGPLSIKKQ